MAEVLLRKPKGSLCWLRLFRLYREAFPAAERKPFAVIVRMYRQGKSDIWCLERGGQFVGLAITINGGDLILLDYFAVVKRCRGLGIGSAAMGELQRVYAGKGFFVEIESTRESCPDLAQRQKRKRFYDGAGLTDLGVQANVFGVRMELLGSRCSLDFEGYRAFYHDHYGAWAAAHLHDEGEEHVQ